MIGKQQCSRVTEIAHGCLRSCFKHGWSAMPRKLTMCVSTRPISKGPPACLMEEMGEAPVPPSWPLIWMMSALAFATPDATVPMPAWATSFTLTLAVGAACKAGQPVRHAASLNAIPPRRGSASDASPSNPCTSQTIPCICPIQSRFCSASCAYTGLWQDMVSEESHGCTILRVKFGTWWRS